MSLFSRISLYEMRITKPMTKSGSYELRKTATTGLAKDTYFQPRLRLKRWDGQKSVEVGAAVCVAARLNDDGAPQREAPRASVSAVLRRWAVNCMYSCSHGTTSRA